METSKKHSSIWLLVVCAIVLLGAGSVGIGPCGTHFARLPLAGLGYTAALILLSFVQRRALRRICKGLVLAVAAAQLLIPLAASFYFHNECAIIPA